MEGTRDMRTRILDAAIAVIEEQGEASLRLREVAARVGVAEPSLYHHFNGREDLVSKAQALRYRRGIAAMTESYRSEVERCSTSEQFFALIRTFYERSLTPERAASRSSRIAVFGSAQDRADLRADVVEAQREAMVPLVDALAIAQRKGWVRADLDLTALAYWHVGHMTSRVFVEMAGDPQLNEQWYRIALDAAIAVMRND